LWGILSEGDLKESKFMQKRITRLFDPYKWNKIFIELSDLLIENAEAVPNFLQHNIIEPLGKILNDESVKNGHSFSFCTGAVLLVAAQGVIKKLGTEDIDPREYAWDIDYKWRQWHEENSKVIHAKMKKFEHGGKKKRLDALGLVMKETFLELIKDKGRSPTALELWGALRGQCVQEIVDDTLYWRRRNGKEETTSFKSFQNRYTNLKKKLKNKIPPIG
jgi:hypothetical protein